MNNEFYIIEDSILKALTETGSRQETFTLPEGITDIADGVFDNVSVKEITFPSSLKQIPESVLSDHEELEKVIISTGTEKILEYAFYSCSSLTEVTIPDTVSEIEMFAFQDCESLKRLHLPKSLVMLESGAFFGCSALEYIDIPEGVVYIHDDTFYGCESLKKIVLPDSLRTIYGTPFRDCTSLKTLDIPENVSRIDDNAFLGCTALTDIFIESGELELGDGVYVPNGCRVHHIGGDFKFVQVYQDKKNKKNEKDKKMTDEEAKQAYFEVCRHEFPKIVSTIENYCSAGYDGTFENSEYRTKEEVLDFALRLITDFGPYPSENGFTKDAWDYAFDDWDEICPPTPGLKACGTDSMSDEDLSRWYEENYESLD